MVGLMIKLWAGLLALIDGLKTAYEVGNWERKFREFLEDED